MSLALTVALTCITAVLVLQLIVMLALLGVLHRNGRSTDAVHTAVDDIRTDLSVDRNRAARWHG